MLKRKSWCFFVSLIIFTSLLYLVNAVLLEREKSFTLGQNDTSTYKMVEMNRKILLISTIFQVLTKIKVQTRQAIWPICRCGFFSRNVFKQSSSMNVKPWFQLHLMDRHFGRYVPFEFIYLLKSRMGKCLWKQFSALAPNLWFPQNFKNHIW